MVGEGKSFSAGADLNWMKKMANYTERRGSFSALDIDAGSCTVTGTSQYEAGKMLFHVNAIDCSIHALSFRLVVN